MIIELGDIVTKSRPVQTKTFVGAVEKRFNASDVLQSTTLLPDFIYQSGTDSIVYTNKPRSQRSRSNMCRQYVERFNYIGDPAAFYRANEKPPLGINGWYELSQNPQRRCCEAKDLVVGTVKTALGVTTPPTAYLGANGLALINSAWQKLQPDLTRVSVPNFLLDIEDITQLYKLWKKSASVVKNVAGLHLNYKFGWKPTIGDVKDMALAITRFRDNLAAFEAAIGGKVQVSSKEVNESSSITGNIEYPTGSHVYYNAKLKRSVSAYITYAPQPLAVTGELDRTLRGFIDSIGVELNPRILWDAVPFTFVVDWFFGVGNWLSRFKVDALELPVSLVDSCLQLKDELEVSWYWLRHPADGYYSNEPKSEGAAYSFRFFQRMPIFPDFASLTGLGWRLPNFNQATLLLSLGAVLS